MSVLTLPTLLLALSVPPTQISLSGSEPHDTAWQTGCWEQGSSVDATELGQSGFLQRMGRGTRISSVTQAGTSTYAGSGVNDWFGMLEMKTRWSSTYASVEDYKNLEEGWDGDRGMPASNAAADAARLFLAALPDSIPEPTSMISSDGEIGFYWLDDGRYAEAGFNRDGRSYFFSEGVCDPVHTDEFAFDDTSVHQELLKIVQRPVLLAA